MPKPADLPIHLFLPAFNEGEVIEQVIEEIRTYVVCPIIVIDDGSTDNTAEAAKRAGARVVSHMINRGAGAACMTGINLARQKNWPCIVFMDADGQHHPQDLIALFEVGQSSKADLIIGSRFMDTQNKIPGIRRFFNKIANLLTNIFCKHNYSDTQSGFRLLRTAAIQQIDLVQDDFSYCSEMLLQAEHENLQIAEHSISVRYTSYSIGKGQDFQVGLYTAFHFLWKIMFR